jgi:FAD:protein FMN transferase
MGTVVTFDLYAHDDRRDDATNKALDRALGILQAADDVFSTWKMDSPLSRLRRGELSLGEAPPEVTDVLVLCRLAREISGGWFDPWAMPGGVNPTGFVKGWAAQLALEAFASCRLSGALVNAAGDVAGFGGPQAATPFRIGIADPRATNRLACVVELAGAIATSGTYERGEHLIDPHTRRPASRLASASVTGPDLGLADALATALAVAGHDGLPMVAALDGYEALAIDSDGTWRWTEQFPFASPTPSLVLAARHRRP